MNIRWDNVFGLLLSFILLYLLIKSKPILEHIIEEIQYGSLDSNNTFWLFNIFALLCFTAIALVTIIKRR